MAKQKCWENLYRSLKIACLEAVGSFKALSKNGVWVKVFLLVVLVIKIPCEKLLQFDGKMVRKCGRNKKQRNVWKQKFWHSNARNII